MLMKFAEFTKADVLAHPNDFTVVRDSDVLALEKEISDLRARLEAAEALLRSCYGDYSHVGFTDRHGMADRIKAYFAETKTRNAALQKGSQE